MSGSLCNTFKTYLLYAQTDKMNRSKKSTVSAKKTLPRIIERRGESHTVSTSNQRLQAKGRLRSGKLMALWELHQYLILKRQMVKSAKSNKANHERGKATIKSLRNLYYEGE